MSFVATQKKFEYKGALYKHYEPSNDIIGLLKQWKKVENESP